jgi:hypothetical protein
MFYRLCQISMRTILTQWFEPMTPRSKAKGVVRRLVHGG